MVGTFSMQRRRHWFELWDAVAASRNVYVRKRIDAYFSPAELFNRTLNRKSFEMLPSSGYRLSDSQKQIMYWILRTHKTLNEICAKYREYLLMCNVVAIDLDTKTFATIYFYSNEYAVTIYKNYALHSYKYVLGLDNVKRRVEHIMTRDSVVPDSVSDEGFFKRRTSNRVVRDIVHFDRELGYISADDERKIVSGWFNGDTSQYNSVFLQSVAAIDHEKRRYALVHRVQQHVEVSVKNEMGVILNTFRFTPHEKVAWGYLLAYTLDDPPEQQRPKLDRGFPLIFCFLMTDLMVLFCGGFLPLSCFFLIVLLCFAGYCLVKEKLRQIRWWLRFAVSACLMIRLTLFTWLCTNFFTPSLPNCHVVDSGNFFWLFGLAYYALNKKAHQSF